MNSVPAEYSSEELSPPKDISILAIKTLICLCIRGASNATSHYFIGRVHLSLDESNLHVAKLSAKFRQARSFHAPEADSSEG